MITIILLALIGGIIGVVITDWYDETFWEKIGFGGVAFSLFAILGGLIGFCVALLLPADKYYKKHTNDIVTIQDNSSVSGSFFLGSGSIEGSMKYVFYQKDGEGFKMRQISHESAVVKYSNSPKVITYTLECTNSIINWFALDCRIGGAKYEIHVPEGTINTGFNLDAK